MRKKLANSFENQLLVFFFRFFSHIQLLPPLPKIISNIQTPDFFPVYRYTPNKRDWSQKQIHIFL